MFITYVLEVLDKNKAFVFIFSFTAECLGKIFMLLLTMRAGNDLTENGLT